MKSWLKRVTPDRKKLREHKHLRVFGKLLHDPNLWHLNRRSASGGVAVGLFVMFLPPLGQMLIAAAVAIAIRVNLPISVAVVWITNPLTIPPMFYFAYVVGSWVMGRPVEPLKVEFWLEWRNWLDILAPLTVGGLICGAVCSAAGYFIVQGLWRWNLMRQIRKRRRRLEGGPEEPSSQDRRRSRRVKRAG